MAEKLSRIAAAAAGAVAAGWVAALLEARWARVAIAEPPALLSSVLAAAGVAWPVALVVGVGVGVASLFLHPAAAPSLGRLSSALDPDEGRRERALLCLLTPVAAVAWLVVAARLGLGFLASPLGAKPSAAAGVLASALALLALYALVLGGARLLSQKLALSLRPTWALSAGVALAALLFGYAVATGTTSGAGGTLAIFGVLKRDELDLRAPGLLALMAAAAYLAPAALGRVPVLVLAAVALVPGGLLVRAAGSGLDDRKLALAAERVMPLSKLVVGRLRKLSDADKDGFSARFGGGDCDDRNPAVNPGADDAPGNGLDEDCSGRDSEAVKIEAAEPAAPSDVRQAALAKLPQKLNVVLISIDTLRFDLGYMGNPRPVSPKIDALAKQSVVFDKAYALASYTSKSLAPALIGKYPNETHRGWAHFNRFGKNDTFVAERLQKAGIRTLSVQGYWYFFQEGAGFERGFDVIDSSAAPKNVQVEGDRSFNSEKISDAAIALVGKPEQANQPFFMWVHYVDPHAEYVKHEGFDFGGTGRDLYDSEVAYVDHHVGRLIDAIEKSPAKDRTAIVITSDHGEAFGEHGMLRHGFEVWEELIRVPLIVYLPGVPPRKVGARRGAIDLVPTVLDLFRLPAPSGEGTDFVSGTSLLLDLIQPAGHEPKPRIVFAHMTAGPNNADRQAFIDGPHKLITSDGRPLGLYDLEQDPAEKKDLLDDAALKEKVMGRYRAFVKGLREVKVKPQ
ncbi:MAG: sulfatase-like hydrolase/transferase [Polyangiaceae bacterium]|nr:sulfatase-like hydrolase/transferase [Polyangiaceae bacterium]